MSQPPASSPAPSGPRKTILLVEDEAAVRSLARLSLQLNGYQVLDVSGGDAALELADRYAEPIDLVVTDVLMPGMTGRQLVGRLLHRRPDLKVLYISGYTNRILQGDGNLDPGVSLLLKPFTPTTLARKVREILGESNERSV